jgi:hypothetical protein
MADQLAVLDRRITEALAALRRARGAAEHPGDTIPLSNEDMAERRLNGLLDQRGRVVLEQRETALAGASRQASGH